MILTHKTINCMGIKEKIEAEIEKAKAKNQSTYEKTDAEFESDGLTRKLKQASSEIKKMLRLQKPT